MESAPAFTVSNLLMMFTNSDFLNMKNFIEEVSTLRFMYPFLIIPYVAPCLRFKENDEADESSTEFVDAVVSVGLDYILSQGIIGEGGFNMDALQVFLQEAASILNKEQKLAILINICDQLLADGFIEEDEQALFEIFLDEFGVSEGEFQPYLNTLMIKHDHSLF